MSIHYDLGLGLAEFDTQPDLERQGINGWVAEQTNGLIDELFGPGSITESTTIVLVNALYLKAPWSVPFSLAGPWDFTLLDEQVIPVETIRNQLTAGYGVGADYQAVAVDLRGDQLEFVVIMPNDISAFEDSLDSAKLAEVFDSLAVEDVDLRMPIFRLDASFTLDDELAELGMSAPFDDPTCLDALVPGLGFIQTVVHKTVIEIDEDGIEAAAATGIDGGDGDGDGDPPPPTLVIIDKPFLLAIRDQPTGTLLFFGRVLDPTL